MFSGMKLERMYRGNKGYKYEKDASSKTKEESTCRHTGVTLWYGLTDFLMGGAAGEAVINISKQDQRDTK